MAREEGVGALWKGLEPGAFSASSGATSTALFTATWKPFLQLFDARLSLSNSRHVPGLHRQCLFGGLRIGLYEPVKQLIVGKDHVGDVSLLHKIVAGLATGAQAHAYPYETG